MCRVVEDNPYASTPDGEYIRIPCLILAKRYDEALYYVRREKKLLQETTDTVNWDYINPHLQTELEAYVGKNDYRSVARVQATMFALADTLRKRERDEDALELAEIYKTNEKEREIERQADSLQRHQIVFSLLAPIVILHVLYIWYILRTGRVIRRKNEAMVKTIDELMSYKGKFVELQEENIRLSEELRRICEISGHCDADNEEREDETGAGPEDGASMSKMTEKYRSLFERVNYEIVSRKLYLQPNFNKQELLKEIHIPANKFAALFREFAGCGFSQYIQDLRLDYAVRLMKEQPLWSLEAIAKEAQMSKAAFYSQFQKKYGMKPSQYRLK